MTKLWETHAGARRLPIKIKRHSRFTPGWTVTLVGTRWSRTWGILPKGDQRHRWTGGLSWEVKGVPYGETLTRPTVALCKWRYR